MQINEYDYLLRQVNAECKSDIRYNICVEECAEFIVSLQHFLRGRVTSKEIVEEIADVFLTLRGLILLLDLESEVNNKFREKARRLQELYIAGKL